MNSPAPIGSALPAAPQEQDDCTPLIREAITLLEDEQLDEAIVACEAVLKQTPDCAEAFHILGLINFDLDEPAAALKLIEAAHQLKPEQQEFAEALAALYARIGDVKNALYYAKLGTVLEPHAEISGLLPERYGSFFYNLERGRSDLYSDLASRKLDAGEFDAAISACETQLELTPGDQATLRLLAESCLRTGQVERAISASQAVLHGVGTGAEDSSRLARALAAAGRHQPAAACHRRAMRARPREARLRSLFLADQLRDPDQSRGTVDCAHLDWQTRFAARIDPRDPSPEIEADPERPLRIGYLSCDLHDSDLVRHLEPLLQVHRHRGFEVYCYADGGHSDAVSERLMVLARKWTDIDRIDDETLWQIMRGDRIDVAVDLTGHGPHCRALAMARRPAPVALCGIGYHHAPGLPGINGFLTDNQAWPVTHDDPASGDSLVRLPEGLFCYVAPSLIPEVEPLPASLAGHVTFGAQMDLRYIQPEGAALWVRLLEQVPGSRLLICNALDLDQSVIDRAVEIFSFFGARNRLDIINFAENFHTEFEFYSHLDIALDPPGVSVPREACHALWMGVPVLSLAGDRHGSRLGASLLASADCQGWAAESTEDLLAAAVELCHDKGALAAERESLREKVRASRLADPCKVADGLESTYRRLWRAWCDGKA